MKLIRRLAGLLSGAAGAIGLVLCVAGLVGVWVGHVEVVRRVDRVFGGADQALTDTDGNLHRAADQLRKCQAELAAVREREADLTAHPPDQRAARRELSRKAVEGLGPQLGEARVVLEKATEIGLVANGLLDALAELPAVERSRVDTDRLKETSAQVGELTDQAARVSTLLARAAPATDTQVGDETSRADGLLRRTIGLAEEGSDRLATARQKVADGRARLMRWINGLAVALTIVLVWIAAGQVSLLIHGWSVVRR